MDQDWYMHAVRICTINGMDATYERTYRVLYGIDTMYDPTNHPSFQFIHHPEERGFASLAPMM